MIISWNSDDVDGLAKAGLDVVLIELSEKGSVLREIGMKNGKVIYRSPGDDEKFPGGLFDLQSIDTTNLCEVGDVDKALFGALWNCD